MSMATLNYITKDNKILILNRASLMEIDRHTRCFKSKKEVFDKYKNKIESFEKNIDGDLKIFYYKNETRKEVIPLLYKQSSPLYIKDDYITNNISEIEKVKRLIFNSKGDIFIRLLLRHDILSKYTYYYFEVMDNEYKVLSDLNIKTIYKDKAFYVRIDELLKYKMNHKKLGSLRNIFDSIISSWKSNIESLNEEELYFISREFRLLISEYDKLKMEVINIKDLIVFKKILKIENYKLVTKQKKEKIYFE